MRNRIHTFIVRCIAVILAALVLYGIGSVVKAFVEAILLGD